MKRSWLVLVGIAGGAWILFGPIEGSPPLWWDEGWTLSVARHWVETGHYGLLSVGQPAPSTMAAHFPVVLSVAAGFQVFGVGVWQGRLVMVMFTVLATGLLVYLAARLYGAMVGIAAGALILLFPSYWEIHPLMLGRQVLGEMPMLAFLLAGYLCFLLTERSPMLFLPLAGLCWGIGLSCKQQALPFWLCSMVVPLGFAMLRRQWPLMVRLAVGLGVGLLMQQGIEAGRQWLLEGHTTIGPPVVGLLEASATVLRWDVRLSVMEFSAKYLLPAAAAFGYWILKESVHLRRREALTVSATIRLMLLVLGAGWLGWFALCSVGWPRYAFPPAFVAVPFLAAMLADLTDDFQWRRLALNALAPFRPGGRHQRGARSLVGILLLVVVATVSGKAVVNLSRSERDVSVQEVAAYVNRHAGSRALVESYDSELFFFLSRPYHYPPPQVNVEFIRRIWHNESIPYSYDPGLVKADYLVLGPFSRWSGLYDSLVASGEYRRLSSTGRYDLYERIGRSG
jgi:hypothetical protein